ncbi:hypothetical protein C468_01685 [Halorubrum kocurii JCM 14978]|uniref:Uncharacterized protein n=1 Tax=Halorubrum kocurii JCM 14978 TaxID=1230456 RepID=M0PKF2_9EURY|nr:hypothetical protein C468_01685 [Halorubrum kocurii JCM 14978]
MVEASPLPGSLPTVIVLSFTVVAFLVFALMISFVTVIVVVSAFDEVDTSTGSDDIDVGVVVTETRHEVVSPRLEALHSVEKEVRFEDCSLNLWPWFPPVAVLADRDERLCGRGVACNLAGQVPEYEERRLGFRHGILCRC